MTYPAWHAQAECRPENGHPKDFWFPHPTDRAGRLAAARICHTCPVEDTCLQAANRQDERYGVWGGLTRDRAAGGSSRIGPGPAKQTPTPDQRCGSPAGYTAHRRRNEKPCDACREAERLRSNYSRYGQETR